jgi:hypothetical protein
MTARGIIQKIKTALENGYDEQLLERQIDDLLLESEQNSKAEMMSRIKNSLTQAEREGFWENL